MSLVDKTSVSVEFYTPPWLLDVVRRYAIAAGFAGIEFDPATDEDNWTGALHRFTAKDDGLARGWDVMLRGPPLEGDPDRRIGTFVWLNSPYGGALRAWVEKAALEARDGRATVVALLPGQRFEQRYWQEHLLDSDVTRGVVAIAGRVDFFGRVCARCGDLESSTRHARPLPDGPGVCTFEWSKARRAGGSNPYGSFLYCLGRGHRPEAAHAILSEVGHVFELGRTTRFAPPAGSPRARRGIARPVKTLFDETQR